MSEFELRRALRALDGGRTPERDLWPGIAARLGQPLSGRSLPEHPRAGPGRGRWPLLLALAASLVLAVVLALPLLPEQVPATDTAPLVAVDRSPPRPNMRSPTLLHAEALALEYAAVLQQFDGARLPPTLQPALADLDGSAREIQAALRQDPQSDFLLGQLRRTYAQRLHVTRLALAG